MPSRLHGSFIDRTWNDEFGSKGTGAVFEGEGQLFRMHTLRHGTNKGLDMMNDLKHLGLVHGPEASAVKQETGDISFRMIPESDGIVCRKTDFKEKTKHNYKDRPGGKGGCKEKLNGLGKCGVKIRAHDRGDANHDWQNHHKGPAVVQDTG